MHSDITNSMLCSITTKVAPCSALIACSRSLQIAEHGQVDAAGRLVEQHEARPGHEGHRGVEQLLLAVGQAAGLLVGEMPEPEEVDHLVGRRPEARHRAARTAATASCPDAPARPGSGSRAPISCGKTCSSWKVRLTPSRLRSQGRMPVTSLAVDLDLAVGRLQLAEDAVEQGRLAAAVRADDAEDLALAARRRTRRRRR